MEAPKAKASIVTLALVGTLLIIAAAFLTAAAHL